MQARVPPLLPAPPPGQSGGAALPAGAAAALLLGRHQLLHGKSLAAPTAGAAEARQAVSQYRHPCARRQLHRPPTRPQRQPSSPGKAHCRTWCLAYRLLPDEGRCDGSQWPVRRAAASMAARVEMAACGCLDRNAQVVTSACVACKPVMGPVLLNMGRQAQCRGQNPPQPSPAHDRNIQFHLYSSAAMQVDGAEHEQHRHAQSGLSFQLHPVRGCGPAIRHHCKAIQPRRGSLGTWRELIGLPGLPGRPVTLSPSCKPVIRTLKHAPGAVDGMGAPLRPLPLSRCARSVLC